jgi:hypothetical protein
VIIIWTERTGRWNRDFFDGLWLEAKPGVRMEFLDGIDRIYGMGERGEVQS